MKRMALVVIVAMGVMSAPQAMGQASIGFRGVGASIAYVSPQDLDGTIGLGVSADLGRITPEIGLEPRIEYWSQSQQSFFANASVRDIVIGARAKYYFEIENSEIRPFAGGGLGLHFVKAETSVSIPGFLTMSTEASDTKFGVDLGGGAEMSLSPTLDLIGDVWYGIVSDVNQFSLRLGLSYKLGT